MRKALRLTKTVSFPPHDQWGPPPGCWDGETAEVDVRMTVYAGRVDMDWIKAKMGEHLFNFYVNDGTLLEEVQTANEEVQNP